MSLLRKTQRLLHGLEDGFLLLLVSAMVVIALGQIVLRNGFDTGVDWAEPALRVLVFWTALLGALRASRSGGHIAIDLLQKLGQGALLRGINAVMNVGAALVCAIAAWYCWEFIADIEMPDGTIAFLGIPQWACESVMPAALGLLSVRLLLQALLGTGGHGADTHAAKPESTAQTPDSVPL